MSASVSIIRNPLKPREVELHIAQPEVLVWDWLRANAPEGFGGRIAMTLNGYVLPVECSDVPFGIDSELRIEVLPGDAVTGAILLYSVLTAIASAAITLVISAVFGGRPKSPNGVPSPDPVYTISGQQNAATVGEPVPVIYGRVVVTPPYASQPYTWFEDNDQYLGIILCIGQGDFALSDVLIGETSADQLASGTVTFWEFSPSDHNSQFGVVESATGIFENIATSPEVGDQELLQPSFDSGAPTNNFEVWSTTLTANGAARTIALSDWPDFPIAIDSWLNILDLPLNERAYQVESVNELAGTIVLKGSLVPLVNEGPLLGTIYFWGTYDNGASGVSAGPFVVCNPGKQTDRIFFDIVFPGGLFQVDKKTGNLKSESASFKFRLQAIDDDGNATGAPFIEVDQVFSASTNTPQRRTFEMQVEAARYRASVIRLTPTPQTTDRVSNAVWSGLRSRLTRPQSGDFAYGPVTLLALRIKATNGISSAATGRIRVRVTRKLRVLGFGLPVATRDPIDAFIDACINQVYGARLNLLRLDVDELSRIKAHLAGRARFDGGFSSTNTLWEALSAIMIGCGGSPVPADGLISATIDGRKAFRRQLFNDANITPGSTTLSYAFGSPSDHDGIRVEYRDPQTFNAAFAEWPPGCQDPDAITLPGCTVAGIALQFARLRWQQIELQRSSIAFETELEGLLPRIGDRVGVGVQFQDWGESGRVIHQVGSTIYVDKKLDWISNGNVVILRSELGEPWGPVVVQRGDDDDVIILSSLPPWPITGFDEQEGTLFSFGISKTVVRDFIIAGAEPQTEYKVQMVAQRYNEDVFIGTMPWLEEAF